jgi:oligopeptide transport system ATP-binding protein
MNAGPLLSVRGLTKRFTIGRAGGPWGKPVVLTAVDDMSFDVARGETLAVIGESGSGKSTLARVLLGLEERSSGSAAFDGVDLFSARGAARRTLRRRIQAVFQDPYASMNPAHRIDSVVAEPWIVHRGVRPADQPAAVLRLLASVGLGPDIARRYPDQLSGGQRQRVGIARALATAPDLVICDEPLSALDVSVQSQVLNVLMDLQAEKGLSYLFIGHDLGVVRLLATRVAVVYLGRMVELATTRELFSAPRHPYSRALLSAVAKPRGAARQERIVLAGDPPSPADPPSGCAFRTRCWKARALCAEQKPTLAGAGGHAVACHFPED